MYQLFIYGSTVQYGSDLSRYPDPSVADPHHFDVDPAVLRIRIRDPVPF